MFCGTQFSIYPMSDDFVDVILGSIGPLQHRDDIRVETDDLSTLVVGTPNAVFTTVRDVYAEACRRGGHVVLSATFSRGCPGEPDDPMCVPEKPAGATASTAQTEVVTPLAIDVAAQYSLYPLGIPSYMDVIYREIAEAKKAACYDRGKNFCTRLKGDLSDVFAVFGRTFESAARETGHVVLTATVSKGSPSQKQGG